MAGKTVEKGFAKVGQATKNPKEPDDEEEKGGDSNVTEELLTETINYMQALRSTKTLNMSPNVSKKLDKLQEKLKVLNSATAQEK